MSNNTSTKVWVTPCGRWQNSKGDNYTYQAYCTHIECCPKCKKAIEEARKKEAVHAKSTEPDWR